MAAAAAKEQTGTEIERPETEEDDPKVFEALAKRKLPTMTTNLALIEAVKQAYGTDSLFKKILEKPKEHPAFTVKDDELIYCRNSAGELVLALPKGLYDHRTFTEIVIEEAHDALGHLGFAKTSDYIRRWYWWPQMIKHIEEFCKSCHKCQTTKSGTQRTTRLLHTLPVPTRPWASIATDFVGPFPKSKDYNYLWVVVDRLTSMVHLIPITTRTKASELAYIFIKEIVRLHGLPESIVSDRDSKFTSAFRRKLHRMLGSKLLMSTAFHPQTDGASERANRTITQMLRSMVEPRQIDWVDHLPLVEFAMNSCRSASTGYAPFELNYGYLPRTLTTFDPEASLPGVKEFAQRANSSMMAAHDAIIASRVLQTHHANKRRKGHDDLKEGSLVYLSTENLKLPTGRAKKLAPKFIGPFPIIKQLNLNVYVGTPATVERPTYPPDFPHQSTATAHT